ncbi:Echinoderm microtubule-associated protein-like 5 [Apostichopus japonicus]|uniref:Echinoderm microtubule-associated protein-like 5 n=1 Tax=Stichopus japonicus TaxID=307972 RepID=A0A2G8JCR8_STIJA|nr:Echinoderm microtubule-associated protein-like 5 [Apostichopus japonicus]
MKVLFGLDITKMKDTFIVVFILASFCLYGNVQAEIRKNIPDFLDCGSVGAKVTSVDLTPCSSDPCTVISGKKSSIAVSFHTTAVATNVTAKVYGSIASVKVPFPLPQADACQKSNLTCPLKAQADYVYTCTLAIPGHLPEVDVVVELDLVVDDKKYLCIEFPVSVKPSSSKVFQKIKAIVEDVELIPADLS